MGGRGRIIKLEVGYCVMLFNKIILVICDNYKGIMFLLVFVLGKGVW